MQLEPLSDTDWTQLRKLTHCDSRYVPLHSEYYECYFEHKHKDLSRAIIHGKRAVAWLLCSESNNELGFYGDAARVYIAPGLSVVEQRGVFSIFGRYIKSLFKPGMVFYYRQDAGLLDPISLILLDDTADVSSHYEQLIPLAVGDEAIWNAIREKYRKYIRWGEDNLQTILIDKDNFLHEHIEKFRFFHLKIAGRTTRPLDSWAIQAEMIKSGDAFIVFSYWNDELVAASLFLCGASTAYYAVGVYERALFDKPLSHYNLYYGMVHVKKLGCHYMNLGDMPLAINGASEKELGIGRFKRGFGDFYFPYFKYKLTISS
ncbi:hypothetical protein [Zobellella iuensis]|uniref:BioF2-like acetyltransferase domain-containing protein n=1 Tax=Zobellella iuensis TaxID=2803811 RepID=A0ABS1QU49_9GAMM|nr:hypothetical protein [Zobellella iuensis]MBL1378403.1 hypothetical protein [Zobellella iuensis]